MKLNDDQTNQILQQTGLGPIPGEMAEASGLIAHFGDDTFYVGNDGIFVFESDETASDRQHDPELLTAIKIAAIERGTSDEAAHVIEVEREQTALTIDMKA